MTTTQLRARTVMRSASTAGPFMTLGEQLQAVARAADRPHEVDQRLYQVRSPAGGSEQVSADGGFLVQPEFSSVLFDKIRDSGQFLKRTTEFTLGDKTNAIKIPGFDEQSRADGSRWGGVLGYWQNEAASLTATRPKFKLTELITKKLTGLCYVTDELLRDGGALEQAALLAFTNELRFKLEVACFSGTGAGQPLGILNSNCLISVAKETGQAAGSVVAANITNMWARMWPASRARACWFIHPDAEVLLMPLSVVVGAAGSQLPLYVPTADPETQPYNLMLGRPVICTEYAATPGSVGDIVFADPSQYVLAQRDIRTDISMHVSFLTDEAAFRVVWRIDGNSLWHTPLTPLHGTNTLSPFVALAAR